MSWDNRGIGLVSWHLQACDCLDSTHGSCNLWLLLDPSFGQWIWMMDKDDSTWSNQRDMASKVKSFWTMICLCNNQFLDTFVLLLYRKDGSRYCLMKVNSINSPGFLTKYFPHVAFSIPRMSILLIYKSTFQIGSRSAVKISFWLTMARWSWFLILHGFSTWTEKVPKLL